MQESRPLLHAFVQGLRAPWQGFDFMCRNPSLRRHSVTPILLNLLVSTFVLCVLVGGVVLAVIYLHPVFPDGNWGTALEIGTAVLLAALAIGVSAILWLILGAILCSYFCEKLAREVELRIGTATDEFREISLREVIFDVVRDVAALIAINVALLAMHCIPLVGSILAVLGTFYFNCFAFGRGFLDIPLSLRGLDRDARHAFAAQHRPQTLGLGASAILCSLIPLVGAVLLTTAATGAVLIYHEVSTE